MKKLMVLFAVLLTGCTIKAEFSMMKQWDRPAERTVVEDTSHNVKQPPRTTIETQDPIKVAPKVEDTTPPAVPGMKPMNYEVPEVIIPQGQKIQTIYLHQHGEDGRACYVRRVVGMYAMNMEVK